VVSESLDELGFAVVPDVLRPAQREELLAVFATATAGRAGDRTGLRHAAVRELASCPAVRALVTPLLGPAALVHRATLFDKHPAANWVVAWHQDLVVPVEQRAEAAGFGPWSHKADGWHVQPSREVLEQLLAVRIDVDGSDADNGALRVLPGTHRLGVLSRPAIAACAARIAAVTVVVPPGGAVLMRPLLLHASVRARVARHRRVVHFEFAPGPLPGNVRFRATAT
jgi:ectoine hydroxylase-related dioxygenase (phytanoyl-CoA dioxygenase family)